MNQNIGQLSLFFETMNENELQYIQKNKSYIENLLKVSNFDKGDKLLQQTIKAMQWMMFIYIL